MIHFDDFGTDFLYSIFRCRWITPKIETLYCHFGSIAVVRDVKSPFAHAAVLPELDVFAPLPNKTMAGLLAEKSAAITGGVTGIGRAITLAYLRQGASVTVNFLGDAASEKHYESLLKEAPAGSKLHGIPGDIGKKETGEATVRGAVDRHGGLDIFVANAGVSQFRDFLT